MKKEINYVLKTKRLALVVLDANGVKRIVTSSTSFGTTWWVNVPTKEYEKLRPGMVVIGDWNITNNKMSNIEVLDNKRCCVIPPASKRKNNVDRKEQHERQHVDAFLCKVKNDLYKKGVKSFMETWKTNLLEALYLYNAINGTTWPLSRDHKKWSL